MYSFLDLLLVDLPNYCIRLEEAHVDISVDETGHAMSSLLEDQPL